MLQFYSFFRPISLKYLRFYFYCALEYNFCCWFYCCWCWEEEEEKTEKVIQTAPNTKYIHAFFLYPTLFLDKIITRNESHFCQWNINKKWNGRIANGKKVKYLNLRKGSNSLKCFLPVSLVEHVDRITTITKFAYYFMLPHFLLFTMTSSISHSITLFLSIHSVSFQK